MAPDTLTVEDLSDEDVAAVTSEEFDSALEEILGRMSPDALLAIPGLYEVVSEALNNEALALAVERRWAREGTERKADDDDDER